MTVKEFINQIAPLIQKYAPQYGIKVVSPIIAQACLESGCGNSKLASKYHNYFGMKCGSSWKGKSVNLSTKEEYSVGTLTNIKANFRVYDNMEEGVKGYFDFISKPRYANLKNVTDPETYLKNIKADGYATSSRYVENNMRVIKANNLTSYDAAVLNVIPMKSTISAAEKATQWMETMANDPAHGYDQIYRWGEKGDYDCSAAVITAYEYAGIPVKTNGATYTGNLRKVFLKTGFKDISSSINKANGNGLQRGDVMLAEGHHVAIYCGDGKEVEASINEKNTTRGGQPGDQTGKEFLIRNYRNYPWTHFLRYVTTTAAAVDSPSKNIKYKAEITTSELNVRRGPDTSYNVCSFSPLKRGTIIEVCDTYTNGWLYIRYNGKYGFVSGKYTKKIIENNSYKVRVTATALRRRSGPGTNYTSYGNLGRSTICTIVEERNGWGKLSNSLGWISLKYTQKV